MIRQLKLLDGKRTYNMSINSFMKDKKAQSTLEFAVVIMCVVAALLAMQIYLKRGMQGRLRQAADELGSAYSPGNTSSDTWIEQSSTTTTTVKTEDYYGDLATTSKIEYSEDQPDTERRHGWEKVGSLEPSLYK